MDAVEWWDVESHSFVKPAEISMRLVQHITLTCDVWKAPATGPEFRSQSAPSFSLVRRIGTTTTCNGSMVYLGQHHL